MHMKSHVVNFANIFWANFSPKNKNTSLSRIPYKKADVSDSWKDYLPDYYLPKFQGKASPFQFQCQCRLQSISINTILRSLYSARRIIGSLPNQKW